MTDPIRPPGPEQGSWLQQARQLLDAEVEQFDYALRSRLNQARQSALATLAPVRHQRWDRWIAGAVAAGLATALAVQLWWQPASLAPAADDLLASDVAELDAELLVASDDQLELYENLEFYAWLQSQPAGG